jgi:hypothetical protein
MSRDTFENTPPLPHVSFGDTFSNPLPPPLERHVLFEWPLTSISYDLNLSNTQKKT